MSGYQLQPRPVTTVNLVANLVPGRILIFPGQASITRRWNPFPMAGLVLLRLEHQPQSPFGQQTERRPFLARNLLDARKQFVTYFDGRLHSATFDDTFAQLVR